LFLEWMEDGCLSECKKKERSDTILMRLRCAFDQLQVPDSPYVSFSGLDGECLLVGIPHGESTLLVRIQIAPDLRW
jgi:hypothetical protein